MAASRWFATVLLLRSALALDLPGRIGGSCAFYPPTSRCCTAARSENDTMLTERMVERGISFGPRGYTTAMFSALEQGKTVRLFIAGGSFTRNVGCTSHFYSVMGPDSPVCAEGKTWPTQVAEFLQARYPSAVVELHFFGIGSTTTHFGYKLLRDEDAKLAKLNQTFDLVIFDYSCNDAAESASIQLATEASARICTSRRVPFVLLRTCPDHAVDRIESQYAEVAKVYSVPLFSYKNATQATGRSPWWDGDVNSPHPGCSSRHFVANFVVQALAQLRIADMSSPTWHGYEFPRTLPRPRFGAAVDPRNIQINANEACFPAATDLNWLNEAQLNAPKGMTKRPFYVQGGWEFRRDAPKHPPGWICTSDTPGAWLAFEVELNIGAITITYLETYRNAGVVEVWIGGIPGKYGSANGIRKVAATPETAYKTPRSKREIRSPRPGSPPAHREHTKSYFIDTFNPNSTTSNLQQYTIDFDSVGEHLVHLRHFEVSDAARRGGDKVKIMAIRSC